MAENTLNNEAEVTIVNRMEALLAARTLLEDATPLKNDCGRVCGGACCQPDAEGQGGMLLFPGEESFYDPLPEGFAISPAPEIEGALLLTCSGFCDRKNRPLSCRLFPLLPREKDGCVRAVRDRRGFIVCPLLTGGIAAFHPVFRSRVVRAGEILYAQPDHRAFLTALHRYIRSFEEAL